MSFRDLRVLDVVEVFLLIPNFVGIPEKRPHQPVLQRLQANDVLAVRQYDPANSDHVHVADGFADNRKGVVSNFAVGDQIVGTDEIAWVDAAFGNKLVNVDRAGGFQGDVFKPVLRHFNVSVGIDLVALRDVFVRNFLVGDRENGRFIASESIEAWDQPRSSQGKDCWPLKVSNTSFLCNAMFSYRSHRG